MGQTIAEALIAEGMAKGEAKGKTIAEALFAEGLAKGKAEGEAEGKLVEAREILRNLLLRRFKTLPEQVMDRIGAASDHERLKACINDVFDMTSLDQLDL